MRKTHVALLSVVTLGLLAFTSASELDTRTRMADGVAYKKVCVEGISYLQFSGGVTVQYQFDGKIAACVDPRPKDKW